jgi:nucleotide-binding universal stress UspA family protein
MNGTYRIVVGVDGSEGSDRALRWAVKEAATRGGTVQAVAAWSPPGIAGAVVTAMPAELEQDRAEQALTATMDAVVRSHPGLMLAGEVVEGPAAAVLAEAARDADMLVIGSHGHGRLYHAIMGSVAEGCVRLATCPVVVVPLPHAERVPAPGRLEAAHQS